MTRGARGWRAAGARALVPAVTLGLGLAAGACGSAPDAGPELARGPGDDPPTGWEELPRPPLAARSRVVGVWTGREAILVGGDANMCPPGADCGAPDPPLADGAALDPATSTWRRIAPAPVPFSYASTAVVGEDVYFLADGAFLRYSVGADAWSELTPPSAAGAEAWYRLVAAGDVVVAYQESDERGVRPDLVLDPGRAAWAPLPDDPLSPAFDRTMAWAGGRLYLFDHELVPQPGAERPSLTRVARLDLATGRWERLADSQILGAGPWFVEGGRMVNPVLGSADGGEVGNWGRSFPFGGILETASGAWSELPAPEDADVQSAGVLGARAGLFLAPAGGLLDLVSGRWVELPPPPGTTEGTERPVMTAGADALVYGGQRWPAGGKGELLGDAWIWRSGRGG